MKSKLKMLAIDGNSLLNRAFYGVRSLTNSEGFPTNAIFGFYGTVSKILKEVEPTHVLVAFDLKGETFRHKKFKQYKANRKKMPQELFLQLVEVKKLLTLLGICVCEKEGFEADDLLGTVSRVCSEQNVDCVLASGDRDILQLVSENVAVRLSTNKADLVFDEASIFEKFGVCANQLIEVKALMGDSSDNIPGVRGIGEKTALDLIANFQNIDNIFKNLDNLNISARVKNLLSSVEAKEMCFLSRELGTICLNAGIDENLDVYLKKEIDFSGLRSFLEKFELKKFLKDLDKLCGGFSVKVDKFDSAKKFKMFVNLSVDLVRRKLQSVEFLNFFFYHVESGEDDLIIIGEMEIFRFSGSNTLEAFEALVVSCSKPKRTANLKQAFKFSLLNGLELKNVVFSTDIASYLVNVLEKNHDILSITERLFGCIEVAECFDRVCDVLQQKLVEKNLNFLFERVELPLTKVLAEMEICGFGVDRVKLEEFGSFLTEKIEFLQNEIWNFCGVKFNLNSTKELSEILFDHMNLPKTRKTKTGYSTDAESLLKLAKHSEIALLILDYRAKTKLLSTYVEGWKKVIGSDGRIHSIFNQTQTRTGRISSFEPNVQNIPIKTELGSEMRKFFVAKEGYALIDGDYSQIELRILAAMAGDEKMIAAFRTGQDIHKLTASQLFGVPISEVTDEFRRRAKTVNFSVIYGISAFSLAKDIGVSVASAQAYIDSFFEGYGNISAYFEELVETAKKTGEVKTMFGRVRKIPELSSSSKRIVALGERIAKNTPIQGTCADLIKIAMINVSNKLKLQNLDAKLVLQVHDELLIESEQSCVEEATQILKSEMERVAELAVPLEVEVSVGKTWFDCKF